tara:strand:+ start:574 stop:735 length:162 start_codon:yes stop_codon:yes gene_type:complete
MPWDIRKRGSKYQVVKKDGKVVGTHSTKAKALKQQAALYSSEKKGKMSRRRKS